MRTRISALTLLAVLAVAPAARADDPKIPYEQYKLPNGLDVMLVRDNSVPLVAVDVWYHVGSGDETVGKSGYAHLFEHMMFQGSGHTEEDAHFRILRKIGVSQVNGTTNTNRTNYFEVVPSNQLETALWLESDRMGYLLERINDKSLANQIDVVRNERRQSYDNRPYGVELFKISELLFPEGHPYRYLTIGRHEDLEKASVDDVKGFFKKWYVPSNATLVLAGDFDPAEAKKMVAKWFGSFPATPKPAHREVAMPKANASRVTVEDKLAKLRRVHFAWNTPKLFGPGDAELDILSSALGDQGTGRLYKILVHEKQLAQSVTVFEQSAQLSSTYHVIVDLKSDADLATVEKIVEAELDRVMKEPISQKEFARAVVGVESSYVWGLESLFSRADTLQQYNHFVGTPDYITQDLDRYRKSSPQKVLEVARTYLPKAGRVEVITMPAEAK